MPHLLWILLGLVLTILSGVAVALSAGKRDTALTAVCCLLYAVSLFCTLVGIAASQRTQLDPFVHEIPEPNWIELKRV